MAGTTGEIEALSIPVGQGVALGALGTTVSVRQADEAGLQCGAGRGGERESVGVRLGRRAGEPGDDHAGAGHGGYFEAGDKQVGS
jgi:hypothetical protein